MLLPVSYSLCPGEKYTLGSWNGGLGTHFKALVKNNPINYFNFFLQNKTLMPKLLFRNKKFKNEL